MVETQKNSSLLLLSIFIIAVCGLVYELLAGTVSSYLIGDSVYQFSVAIGIFMSSMGLGSYLSRLINRDLPTSFILIEVILGIIGGFSTLILFIAFAFIDNYTPFLFIISILIGTLIGLEIPIILRILKKYESLKIIVSNVMTADYIGALVGALLFPIIFVPYLGLIRTGVFFGLMNLAAGGLGIYIFRDILNRKNQLILLTASAFAVLVILFIMAGNLTTFIETNLYSDEIIYAKSTPYQRIVLTRREKDVSMFINGSIQFNTQDEYRYHESLVHPAMNILKRREDILILGGGDGLACRELLKYSDIKSITIVDIDPAVTELFKRNPLLRSINHDSLNNRKVTTINRDAWKFLENSKSKYDLIIIDLPDPHDLNISKLYTKSFYTMVASHLNNGGLFVTQATSPLYARKAFWCIYNTIADTDCPYQRGKKMIPLPYHLFIPSFGEWGFVIGSQYDLDWDQITLKEGLKDSRFLSNSIMKNLAVFPKDMERLKTEVNTIDAHPLVPYYENGWAKWYK